jgi:threonyl-tRNA synthetase
VRNDHDVYALYVAETLALEGIRVSVEEASEPLGSRIRKAKLEKVPYILVVGDDDVEKGTLGVNARGSNDPERGVSVAAFRERVLEEIAMHGSPEDL